MLQLAELMPVADADTDPEQMMVGGLNAFLRAVEARPDAWRVILTPTEAMPGRVSKAVQRQRTRIASQLGPMVRWGLEELNAEIKDVELMVETIILLIESAARRHLANPESYPIDRFTAFTASMLKSVKR